jgi:hypothetical protein
MTDELLVELYDTVTAVLRRAGSRIELEYTAAARARWGVGSPVLSCSLPIVTTRSDATEFIKNLLPDNENARAHQSTNKWSMR